MSINKTENYQLHSWIPEDNFLLSEINENFARLDGATQTVFGTYTGDGKASQLISLGFTPQAVLVIHWDGKIYTSDGYWGGLVLGGIPIRLDNGSKDWVLGVEEGGFRAYFLSFGGTAINCNGKNEVYHYLALR